MDGIDFDNVKEYRHAHDYHFDQFIKTKDFKHFEAARAIAVKIIKYERSACAFRFSMDLEKMYWPEWRNL